MIGDDTNEPTDALTAAAVINRLAEDLYKAKDQADEWEQIIANKNKEIERLKIRVQEETELHDAWRKRCFDTDGWSFSGKVEHLSYVNGHLRNQMQMAVDALNVALKFDPDDEE